jgi:alkyl hydroperoxide reductase subunit AhpC
VLYTHCSAAYTPVCTTELGVAARMAPEFAKRNTKLLAVSVDDLKDHKA